MTELPTVVPSDADEGWTPPGYTPGPDDPGPVQDVHSEHEDDVTEGDES